MQTSRKERGQAALVIVLVILALLTCVGLTLAYLRAEPVKTSADSDELAELTAVVRDLKQQVAVLQDRVEGLQQGPIRVVEREAEPITAESLDPETDGNDDGTPRERGGGFDFRGRGGFDFAGMEALQSAATDADKIAAAKEILEGDNPMAKLQALQVLTNLDAAEAIPYIEALVASAGDDRRTGWVAERAVGLLGEAENVAASDLYRLYDSGTSDIQSAAARALEQQGDSSLMERQIASITPNLSSADGGEQLRAIDKLGSTRSVMAVSYLTPYLADSNSEVRLRTLDALRRTGDESVIPQLEALLNDPVAQVRDRAERTLSAIRDGDTGDDRGFGRGGPGGGRRGR